MALLLTMPFKGLALDTRLDAEYYTHPGFQLSLRFQKTGVPFSDLFSRVIHPGEFTRGYQERPGRLFLRAQNVRPALVDVVEPLYVSEEVYAALPNAIAREGDLLLVRTGANHGDLARVPREFDGVLVSSHTLRLVPSNGTPVHALEFFFASASGRSLLLSLRSGGTHGQINGATLKTLYLPDLSSLESHAKRIAEAIEKKRREAKELYAAAETMLNNILGLAKLDLTPRLFYETRYSETAAAGRIDAEHFQPKFEALINTLRNSGLEHRSLEEIIVPIKNGFDYREFCDEGTPYIRVGDIKQGRLEIENCARVPLKCKDLPKDVALVVGDVLFTRKGSFGNAAHVRPGQEAAIISSEIMLIRRKPAFFESILPEYVSLYFNSIAGSLQAEKWAHGVAFYSISQDDLARFVIPILPLLKQKELKSKIDEAEASRYESRRLLDTAKRAVEIATEDSEAAALKYLKDAEQ